MSPKATSKTAKKSMATTSKPAGKKQVFEAHYSRLNEAQKQAVDTIEGPVMCVAGPGTGKTHTIALRTANILKKTHMRPSNVLCLTFSTSGATAMRERLRTLIGPDAYGVTVKNFHGFCNELIAEHPLVFDSWAALEHISDVERYREVNKIIDQLLPDLRVVNPKSPYGRTRDILSRISDLKREGVTDREKLLSIADEYESVMSGKSKEGTKAHEKNLLAVRKFREFLNIFFMYQDMLGKTQRYDYEDMILYVIRALEEEDWMLAGLQERYQYILVDEFQDTNGAQYRLVELLTSYENLDHEPNLFVVGDDDQAIYRFQGANLTNILSFHERFPDAPVITLTKSYRCSQPILDAAGKVIANNTERLVGRIEGLDKTLTSAAVCSVETPSRRGAMASLRGKHQPPPAMLLSPSDMTEPWMIADIVEKKLNEGVSPKEIAVLVQTNKELFPIYDVFTARGIPVELSGKVDLLSRPLVQQTIAILRAVQKPHDSAVLAAALGCACFGLHPPSPFPLRQGFGGQAGTTADSACRNENLSIKGSYQRTGGLHPADLGRLFGLRRDRGESLYDLLLQLDDPASDLSELVLKEREAIITVRDRILDFHQKLGSRTVVETLEHVMKECGLLGLRDWELGPRSQVPSPKSQAPIDPLEFAALQEFFDRFKFRAYEDPHFSFETFLSDLEYYENPNYGELRLVYDLPHLTEEGIQIMTAHQSKGLEFDTVILANFRDGHWDKRRNPPSLSMPEDLLFGWEKDQKAFERNQDERRIAYVAMTRAKRELIFTCAKQLTSGNKTRDVSPSGFFAEAGELKEELRELKRPEEAATLLMQPERSLDSEFEAFLKERLENFALSVTALNHFLEDPQLFLTVDLLQMPQSKEPSLVYGNAVHDALSKWGFSIQKGEPLSKEGFLSAFRTYLEEREILTQREKDRLLTVGEESLPRYYEQRLEGSMPVIYKVEYPVTTHLGDIPIKGKMDRIDLAAPDSALATIIDFKTGQPKSENQIREGDYFRQLVFYSILLDCKGGPLQPVDFVLDFVGEGSGHPVERAFKISEQEKTELKKIIARVWEKITALDFTPID